MAKHTLDLSIVVEGDEALMLERVARTLGTTPDELLHMIVSRFPGFLERTLSSMGGSVSPIERAMALPKRMRGAGHAFTR